MPEKYNLKEICKNEKKKTLKKQLRKHRRSGMVVPAQNLSYRVGRDRKQALGSRPAHAKTKTKTKTKQNKRS
jgi:hypothetical protein